MRCSSGAQIWRPWSDFRPGAQMWCSSKSCRWTRWGNCRSVMRGSASVDWISSSDPSKGTTYGSCPGNGRGSDQRLMGAPSALPLSGARAAYCFARFARSMQPPHRLGHAVDAEAQQPPARQQTPHGHTRLDELDALTVAQELDDGHRPEDAPQHAVHTVVLEVGRQGVDAVDDEGQRGLGDQ